MRLMKEDINIGDVIYKLCMGNITTYVVTGWAFSENINAPFFNITRISEGEMFGWKERFFENDYNLNKEGLVHNGIFKSYKDAFAYSINPEYKRIVEEHRLHCMMMFNGFYDIRVKPNSYWLSNMRFSV